MENWRLELDRGKKRQKKGHRNRKVVRMETKKKNNSREYKGDEKLSEKVFRKKKRDAER